MHEAIVDEATRVFLKRMAEALHPIREEVLLEVVGPQMRGMPPDDILHVLDQAAAAAASDVAAALVALQLGCEWDDSCMIELKTMWSAALFNLAQRKAAELAAFFARDTTQPKGEDDGRETNDDC